MTNTFNNAKNIHELAKMIRDVLPLQGYEEVAGMIPTAFCNILTMPDDVEGLIAWDESHAVRIGFAADDGVCQVESRSARKTA